MGTHKSMPMWIEDERVPFPFNAIMTSLLLVQTQKVLSDLVRWFNDHTPPIPTRVVDGVVVAARLCLRFSTSCSAKKVDFVVGGRNDNTFIAAKSLMSSFTPCHCITLG